MAENELALFRSRQTELEGELDILRRQEEQRGQELNELRTRLAQLDRSYRLASQELTLMESVGTGVPKGDLLRLRASGERSARRARAGHGSPCHAPNPRCGEAGKRIDKRATRPSAPRPSGTSTRTRPRSPGCKEVVARRRGPGPAHRGALAGARHDQDAQGRHHRRRGPARARIWSRSCRSRTRSWSRPRSARPTSPSCAPGLPAMVKITAYDYSIYGGLKGVVEEISADTIRTSAARASTGCASGPTAITWARRASHCGSSPG